LYSSCGSINEYSLIVEYFNDCCQFAFLWTIIDFNDSSYFNEFGEWLCIYEHGTIFKFLIRNLFKIIQSSYYCLKKGC
jgi:hypothetical protein